jgi:hypothetical protein
MLLMLPNHADRFTLFLGREIIECSDTTEGCLQKGSANKERHSAYRGIDPLSRSRASYAWGSVKLMRIEETESGRFSHGVTGRR